MNSGTLVGCLRRIMNWSLNSTLSEFKTYAANRTIRLGDEQFIEFFDVDLVTLPKILPIWFIDQRKMQLQEEEEEEEKQLALQTQTQTQTNAQTQQQSPTQTLSQTTTKT